MTLPFAFEPETWVEGGCSDVGDHAAEDRQH
jgi:hypothetical protein